MTEDVIPARIESFRTEIIVATIAFTLSCAMGMGMLAVVWYGCFSLM
jgi:hypothetical protein